MSYKTPVQDIETLLYAVGDFDKTIQSGAFDDLSNDLVSAILEEAGKFADENIAPMNWEGDQHGTLLNEGSVTTPPGWKEAYHAWCDAGWNSITGDVEFDGQGMPIALGMATQDIWNSSSLAFSIGTLLTSGAVEAVSAHGSDALKQKYLPKMTSGEWTGTMNLTEPQAGSDLNFMRTKAEPQGDGSYKISGTKIFITYGEHDMTDNIIHLVLARLPDAPAGTRGISLFLVPKFLVNDDGSLGNRNDVYCSGIEHKLGIHASPTCTMKFGEKEGAIGWLIGEENRGLACMFTMMNNARLGVGIQGVAIAERALQQAVRYANERKQGGRPDVERTEMASIIRHPDIRRMLMDMAAKTMAARAICYATAHSLDAAHFSKDSDNKKQAHELASLLTPIAKAFSTDIGTEVASTGIQIHGGMGYIEETGAAQHLRDARICQIYEGTNGIQAIDLFMRKLPQSEGKCFENYLQQMKDKMEAGQSHNDPKISDSAKNIISALENVKISSTQLKKLQEENLDLALSHTTSFLRQFGLVIGSAYILQTALYSEKNEAAASQISWLKDLTNYAGTTFICEANGIGALIQQNNNAVTSADFTQWALAQETA